MKRCMAIWLTLLLAAAGSFAEGERVKDRAGMLREAVTAAPYGWKTLSEGGFAPVALGAAGFDPGDAAFLRGIGISEDWLGDTHLARRFAQKTQDGGEITVVFCGYAGEMAFVFERSRSGEERLLDVLFGTDANMGSPRVVEMAGGRYLLTTSCGHGTGTYRVWTNWYNLDTRKTDLHTVREGYESDGELLASIVTHTNVDDSQDVSQNSFDEDTLITYSCITVSEAGESGYAVLDDDCAVNVYESRDGGLVHRGERVFDTYTSALLEQASADELLDPGWSMEAGEELLDTARMEEDRLGLRELAEAIAPALRKARIVNAAWVNLRQEGSKESPSVAEITDAETVCILKEKQGFENGWTQVLYIPGEGALDREPEIGYIWWSFLEETE